MPPQRQRSAYQVVFDAVDLNSDVDDLDEERQRQPQQNVAHQAPAVAPTLRAGKQGLET